MALAAILACGGDKQEAPPPAPEPAIVAPTASPTPSPTAPPTPRPAIIETGAWVEVVGTDSCLNMRAEPGLDQPIRACQPDGFVGRIGGGPVERDGHRWWQVEGQGWASEQYLRYSPAPDN